MKKVTAYEAEDGTLHRTPAAAAQAEATAALDDWVDSQGIGRGGEWSGHMVAAAMLEDARTLHGILSELLRAWEREPKPAFELEDQP
jgi:hypothetical protein